MNQFSSNTGSNTVIENSRFEYNGYGVDAETGTANVTIRNSVLADNNIGVITFGFLQARPVLIFIDTCTIAHNTAGTWAQTDGAGSATIRVTNSTIYNNSFGMIINTNGAIESYGNNRVLANTNNSTFSGTVLPLQ